MKGFLSVLGLLASLFTAQHLVAADANNEEKALWDALRSPKHFALMRHALAPGTGDPANFTLGRRETQRNLSEQGRQQAQRIGALFRENGIESAQVFTSEWFRCRDTAELLGLGAVTPLPALNSFFRNYEQKEPRTEALKRWLSQRDMDEPLVLVTHQVNITALTGVYPASGEIVVVAQDAENGLRVLGSIRTDL
ncbi:histidine phosphatase family protein [Marinobacterium stanieri]|uniref:Histidine phosphatase superfamily (Branch 1) n=1 Tax=Marinobacterium stanieri TaxID=49186 RepID=A0A1N6U5C0_9GAMM|nr:histidine phosphatase family protein [Marinobacterium stanieri]SIQ60727.1 Histidine phosphatase superfamily (branch 1) [Marinobacterium stanieri]